ncbi:hypothetical protein [Salinirarus marinus]|uniref:hypothetical protein n=1 Tax=Salinirarus marinus TaxID=3068310 RepID=UPI003C6C8654
MTADDVPPDGDDDPPVEDADGDDDTGEGVSTHDRPDSDRTAIESVDADALTEGYRLLDENHRLRTTLLYATVLVSVLYVALVASTLVSALGRLSLARGLYLLVASVPFLAFGVLVRRLGDALASLSDRRATVADRLFPPDATPAVADETLSVDELAGVYFLAFLVCAGVGVLGVAAGMLG